MMWFVVATTICVLANNCSLDQGGITDHHDDDNNKEITGSGNSGHAVVATFSLAYYNFCTPGILVYATSFLASHCFSLYNFISTWNRIMSARMMSREVFRTALYHTIHNQTAVKTTTTTTTATNNACPICWEAHQECIAVCQSCRGSFHPECLSQWLDRRNSCPCCRAVLRPAEAAR